MAVGGRKPTPESLHDLHGHPSKGRDKNAAEPKPPAGEFEWPPTLPKITGAERYWDHLLNYAPMRLLRPVDVPLLAKLCIELAIGDRAATELEANGFVITTSNGTLIPSPWVGILHRSIEIARKLSSELALPVTARARIDMNEVPGSRDAEGSSRDADTLDMFLAAGAGGHTVN